MRRFLIALTAVVACKEAPPASTPPALSARVREILEPFNWTPGHLEFGVTDAKTVDGFLKERVVFKTWDGLEAPAHRLTPEGPGPFPGVLLVHGHDSKKEDMTDAEVGYGEGLGHALARAGFVVLAVDVRSFAEFRPDGVNHDTYSARLREKGDLYLRYAVNDARVALEVLRRSPKVDKTRIGMGGASLGAAITFVTMLADEGVRAGLISGFFIPFEIQFSKRHHHCTHFKQLAELGSSVDLAASLLNRRIQIHWGENDPFYNRDDGRKNTEALVARAKALSLSEHLDVRITPDKAHTLDPPAHVAFFRAALGAP